MKKLRTLLLMIGAALPFAIFGQTTYTFDSGGNGYSSDGTTYSNLSVYNSTGTIQTTDATTAGLTPGDVNATLLFHPLTYTGNNVAAVDLTAFESTTDCEVTWKEYLKTATDAAKSGVILRAQETNYNSTCRMGYYFLANHSGTSGQVRFRIQRLDASSNTSKQDQYITISGYTVGPLYLKAKVQGSTLSFYYRTSEASAWTLAGSNQTDATYTSGKVQFAWGWGTYSNLNVWIDDIAYTNLAVPELRLVGESKYVYTGSALGPNSSTNVNFSTSPTVTYDYVGIGSTSYGPSQTRPSNVGYYATYAVATNGAQTARDTLAFEILPTTYEKMYTFASDALGGVAGSTSYTGYNHTVQSADGYMLGKKTKGKMLQPSNTQSITTLSTFGNTGNISNDYSVVWKDYYTATGSKRMVILRGADINAYGLADDGNTIIMGQGYAFYVFNDVSTMRFDIRRINASPNINTILASKADLSNPGIKNALWYKATVKGDSLIFEYSTNGSTWTSVHRVVDATYGSGTTQIAAVNGSALSYSYDYVGYNALKTVFTTSGTVNWSSNSNWTYKPGASSPLEIQSGELVVDQSASASSVKVYPGAKLTLNNGQSLSASEGITLQSDATSTGTFVNKGGTLTTGSATIQQYVTAGRNWYVSSPVSDAKSAVFSAANSSTNKLYVYNETNNTWPQITDNTTDLTAVKGYVANMPASGVVTFTGALNDGNKSIALTRTSGTFAGFNLVGNPYPSYLDWQAAATANPGVTTSIWYRTKTTGDAYTFDTYNASGNLATTNGAKTVTKLIPPMQAFWVYVTAPTTLSLTNAMRFHEDVSGNRLKAAQVENQNVIRLKVANGIFSDEAIVFENQSASNSLDAFDSPKMPAVAGTMPQIYSIVEGKNMVINGFGSLVNREIPIGFNSGVAGSFTLRLNDLASLDGSSRIVLKDKVLAAEFDMTDGEAYTFNSDAVTTDSRFSLVLKAATSLQPKSIGSGCTVYREGGRLVLEYSSKIASDARVSVYNALGQLLMSQKVTGQKTSLDLPATSGMLILKASNAGTTSILKTSNQ